jgi:hypothetical protein
LASALAGKKKFALFLAEGAAAAAVARVLALAAVFFLVAVVVEERSVRLKRALSEAVGAKVVVAVEVVEAAARLVVTSEEYLGMARRDEDLPGRERARRSRVNCSKEGSDQRFERGKPGLLAELRVEILVFEPLVRRARTVLPNRVR